MLYFGYNLRKERLKATMTIGIAALSGGKRSDLTEEP